MGASGGLPLTLWRVRGPGARRVCMAALLSLLSLAEARAQAVCQPALAHVVSVQGKVEVRRGGAAWVAVERSAPLCSGDTIRVLPYGRAALRLNNDTLLRLDQGTTLTLAPPDAGKASLFEQLSGALHVITRTPRAFSVKTPFVNANVDGTEFAVSTTEDSATVVVFEGVVEASNAAGSTSLARGEQATAGRHDAPPVKSIAVRPLDAVAWTLYFPAVFDHRSSRLSDGEAMAHGQSLALYREGRFGEALAALGALSTSWASKNLLRVAGLQLSGK